jgi:hypothetical protein
MKKYTEDWQKVNKHDKTDGLSQKAVNAYRRENPGSKLKTAVTTKPSKLKKGSKASKRRASFCARMSGMKKHRAGAKTKRDPDSPINKALRRWNCESIEEMRQLIEYAEKEIAKEKMLSEKWSQKYKNSINCSHPKGFSQRAHCAGKKKQNESYGMMEMVCPDCGMCQSHGTLNEIKKGQKDSNGYTKCWPGHHAAGTKKGKNGGQVRNCVPNESINEETSDPNKLIATVVIDGEVKQFDLTGMFKGNAKSQMTQASDFITNRLEDSGVNFSNIEIRFNGMIMRQQNLGSVRDLKENMEVIGQWLQQVSEEGKAKRSLCLSSKPDEELGASQLSSCKSQGLRARDGNKSHKLGKSPKSRVKVDGKKIKGNKYGGPLPDWS